MNPDKPDKKSSPLKRLFTLKTRSKGEATPQPQVDDIERHLNKFARTGRHLAQQHLDSQPPSFSAPLDPFPNLFARSGRLARSPPPYQPIFAVNTSTPHDTGILPPVGRPISPIGNPDFENISIRSNVESDFREFLSIELPSATAPSFSAFTPPDHSHKKVKTDTEDFFILFSRFNRRRTNPW